MLHVHVYKLRNAAVYKRTPGPECASVRHPRTMAPSPGLLIILALCCAAAAASAGGGQVEAVLQPTLVEAPVSLDTGSSKVTVTCHVPRYPLSRATLSTVTCTRATCHTDHVQDRRAAAETQPFVALLICGYGLTIDIYNIYNNIYNIYNIYHIYCVQNSLLLPSDWWHHRRAVPAGPAAGHRARAGQGEAAAGGRQVSHVSNCIPSIVTRRLQV